MKTKLRVFHVAFVVRPDMDRLEDFGLERVVSGSIPAASPECARRGVIEQENERGHLVSRFLSIEELPD